MIFLKVSQAWSQELAFTLGWTEHLFPAQAQMLFALGVWLRLSSSAPRSSSD